ncbi:exonuclease V a 5' deoxyribonuclease-domain-containing protein [Calycina marina]|uniref:Exonuclease V a 5' deoxyribonuclease-domain-containing protein n=1 Tax=Calycina marina TaxID=1763456 RepID=A0A9P7Z8W0_9HELO|nr:exonuclease V a 5' deoxyribonuclease-domain-containing protein [Calycina marina]
MMASIADTSGVLDIVNDEGNETDYGSEFSPEEEQIVERLLSGKIEIEDNPIASQSEHNDAQQSLRMPRVLGRGHRSALYEAASAAERIASQISHDAQYPDSRRHTPDVSGEMRSAGIIEPALPDTRSPLQRFRAEPRKALSVTDLVSPAWCQLQYWYTLTIPGKKKRTSAMRQGSVVHRKLEEEIYTTVKIEIQTKEDAWGLRIWNVIQGLRTLRETGQTRELEVWGTFDGLVVNGVIDELSYVCPNLELEQSLEKKTAQKELLPDKPTIAEFLKNQKATIFGASPTPAASYRGEKIYICDVKTRAVETLPAESAFRPTKMQLMLYHSMLESLGTSQIDFDIIKTRYKLETEKKFSDSFIAQVGNLNSEAVYDKPEASQESGQWSRDSITTLLAHNSLSALWGLMIQEFQITMPKGTKSLGDVLKAEYRSRENGQILGAKTFLMDTIGLKAYVQREIQWWKGEREAEGVVIEEAFKCRSCDFADGCDWRLKKVDEAKEKARMNRKRTSTV